MKLEKKIIFALALVLIYFFSFGFYHLAQFETADEHLWKFQRIPNYWQALSEHNWEKTYINDKPGITVALISGVNLLWDKNPGANHQVDPNYDQKLFRKYDIKRNLELNFGLRLPVLIFSTLSLLAFFYLSSVVFKSYQLGLITTTLIATSPILMGIAQIINPDSFFWIFGALSALSFLALLETQQKKFLFSCAILLGFSLLSKYTSFILFAFFIIAGLADLIFRPQSKEKELNQSLFLLIKQLLIIFVISNLIFALILPAVIVKKELFFKGIGQFINPEMIYFAIGIVVVLALIYFWNKKLLGTTLKKLTNYKRPALLFALTTLSAIFIISIANLWLGEKIAPVNQLSDLVYTNEPKKFNFKPLIDRKHATIWESFQIILTEIYPFIFSIYPFFIGLILAITFFAYRKKQLHNDLILFSIASFIPIYFLATFLAKIITNARYCIILYPLIAIFVAAVIGEFTCRSKKKARLLWLIWVLIMLNGLFVFWKIKPFYFNYDNFLLPTTHSVHDTWGHGFYEAAEQLNQRPDAEKLVAYSNSNAFCRFFKGQCLRKKRIDLNKVQPDFFVISKRSVIKKKNNFILLNNPHPEKDFWYYFRKSKENPYWELNINGRTENYIRIIEFEKEND